MSVRSVVVAAFTRAMNQGSRLVQRTARDRENVDIVLGWALQRASDRATIRFPSAYLELLRTCLERIHLTTKDVKTDSGASSDLSARRFSTLVEALGRLPAIEFSTAEAIALLADSYRANLKPIELSDWTGDVGSHFEISSSDGIKGRILTAAVRFTRSARCLELGTAYGMSALFLLEALKAAGEGRLTTLEGYEPLFSLSSPLLTARHGDRVSCRLGSTQETLSSLMNSIDPVDLVFHDAGHSRDDYIRDFQAMLPGLRPGGVVLIDDIRWAGGRFVTGNPKCYEGWLELAAHPRVRRAVEVNYTMGLLLVGEAPSRPT
jgi:predicted O-methyltransferase YrrM